MPESWSSSRVEAFSVFDEVVVVVVAAVVVVGSESLGLGSLTSFSWIGEGLLMEESTILICTLLSRFTIGGVSG